MPDNLPVKASSSDITDEVKNGGPAFGSFVGAVGVAVAEAQTKLDQTLVTTALALASKDSYIDVIAIWEQKLDDNGMMTEGHPIIQKLPMINYIMPTAYQWKQVNIRADMYIAKFNAANGFNIKGSYKTESGGGMGGLAGALGARATSSSTGEASLDQTASLSVNAAAGWLHMDATLEPRPDIKPPQPYIVQKGPRMRVTAGPRENINEGGDSAKPVIGRKVTLTIDLKKEDNAPLPGKRISIQVSDPLITYITTPTDGTTDTTAGLSQGTLKIELRREGAAYDTAKPPEPITLKTWLGLITEQIVVFI